MGLYIDPPTGIKEEFLEQHGKRLNDKIVSGIRDEMSADLLIRGLAGEGDVLLCLVDNGDFRGARICRTKLEVLECADDGTMRLKQWFRVPARELTPAVINGCDIVKQVPYLRKV